MHSDAQLHLAREVTAQRLRAAAAAEAHGPPRARPLRRRAARVAARAAARLDIESARAAVA